MLLRTVRQPGHHHCPWCETDGGRLLETVGTEQQHQAGGKPYQWTSYSGRYVCITCDATWWEQIS